MAASTRTNAKIRTPADPVPSAPTWSVADSATVLRVSKEIPTRPDAATWTSVPGRILAEETPSARI
jgi:hypothetical protein